MQTVDLLIRNIGQLATVAGQGPRVGPAASELGIIEGGAVAAIDGRIVAAGNHDTLLGTSEIYREIYESQMETVQEQGLVTDEH